MAGVPMPLAQSGLSALNHVLRQQTWARDRLRAHAGRTIRMVVDSPIGRVSADSRISDEGTLEATVVDSPTVTLSVKPSVNALFAALRDGPKGLSGHLKVEGDVMVAAAVGEIAQHLRWDIEEDLSRLLGDPLAHRLGESARSSARQSRALGERALDGLRQFLIDDGQQLVDRSQCQSLNDTLRDLESRLDRLEARARSAQTLAP